MENKEFDDMFKSLKDREIAPSSNALEQLQNALNEADTKEKKKKPMFIWWVAAAVILLSVGLTIYTSDKLEKIPNGIALPEAKPMEKSEPEMQIQNKQVAEVEEEIDNVEIVEGKSNAVRQSKASKATSNTIEVASSTTEEFKKAKEAIQEEERIDKEEERIDKEEVLLENSSKQDKRLAELLKPVDDAELDSLLQQEQIAIALEEIDDNTILQLLREAQSDFQAQENMQLASSEADRLLQQAEMELKANRSLRNIFNKALETGVVQVEALFKRE